MPRESENGVSYRDVSVAMQELSKAHGGRVQATMTLALSNTAGRILDIRVSLHRKDDKGLWRDAAGTTSAWPSNAHKTMTGMLFSLVLKLEQQLDEERARAERSDETNRLPGF